MASAIIAYARFRPLPRMAARMHVVELPGNLLHAKQVVGKHFYVPRRASVPWQMPG